MEFFLICSNIIFHTILNFLAIKTIVYKTIVVELIVACHCNQTPGTGAEGVEDLYRGVRPHLIR